MNDNTVKLIYDKVLVDREHLKAVQYQFGDDKAWLPRSQIKNDDINAQILTVPEWIVISKGLEGYIL